MSPPPPEPLDAPPLPLLDPLPLPPLPPLPGEPEPPEEFAPPLPLIEPPAPPDDVAPGSPTQPAKAADQATHAERVKRKRNRAVVRGRLLGGKGIVKSEAGSGTPQYGKCPQAVGTVQKCRPARFWSEARQRRGPAPQPGRDLVSGVGLRINCVTCNHPGLGA